MNIFMVGSSGGIGSEIKKMLTSSDTYVTAPTSAELDLGAEFDITDTRIYDGFIYCAGVNYLKKYDEINYAEFTKLLNVNTLSFVKLCSRLRFSDGANIVAIGSLYAETTKELRLQYAMSKHAMLGAVRTLSLEMSPRRIKVNMVSPGFVDTPMTRKNNTTNRIAHLNESIPLGLVSAESIGELCRWFVTKNEYITGQDIKIDGGYSLRGI